MPAGPGPLGFAAFSAVKFVGYTMAAWALKKGYGKSSSNPLLVGLARTAIGLITGISFGAVWLLASRNQAISEMAVPLFFIVLVPIRMTEWMVLIHFFFDRGATDRSRALKYAALGTGWSFVLDAIGIAAAVVIPGGFWIC
jgi:hypothetical protein